MDSSNSLAMSYFHQDNTGIMSMFNERHSSDSTVSVGTASTISTSSDSNTSVHGNTSQRKRHIESAFSETHDTNFVAPRKKSKKYANLPDDVAEFKRLKVNHLEKERQHQLNEVYQELNDLKLPQLIEPGPNKCSKSYIVRNTRCNLQYLHQQKQKLIEKLQRKMKRKELVLVGQGVIPNNGQGNISEVLAKSGLEDANKVACIGYSDFLVPCSVAPANKALNTFESKCMQIPVNFGSSAGRDEGQGQHLAAKGHHYNLNANSNTVVHQHMQAPVNAGLGAFNSAGQSQWQTANGRYKNEGHIDHYNALGNTLVNQRFAAPVNAGLVGDRNQCRFQSQTAEGNYSYVNSRFNDNLYAGGAKFVNQHMQATVNPGLFQFGNAGCSQTNNTGAEGYTLPSKTGNFTPSNANDNSSVQSDNFIPGIAKSNRPVVARNFAPAVAFNFAPVVAGNFAPVEAGNFAPVLAGNFAPVVAGNFAPVFSGNSTPANINNTTLDTFGGSLPVGAMDIKPANAVTIAPFYNGFTGHLNSSYNTAFYSGNNGQREWY